MNERHTAYYASEIGIIEIVGTREGILSINFVEGSDPRLSEAHECLESCITQLDEYFQGKRKKFCFPLQMRGTDFEQKVWRALLRIPYGETRSYADVAEKIGYGNAFRAVGNSNRKNRIAIVIPCHRVIGKNGSLTGYAGGLWRKKWLLEHERRCL